MWMPGGAQLKVATLSFVPSIKLSFPLLKKIGRLKGGGLLLYTVMKSWMFHDHSQFHSSLA